MAGKFSIKKAFAPPPPPPSPKDPLKAQYQGPLPGSNPPPRTIAPKSRPTLMSSQQIASAVQGRPNAAQAIDAAGPGDSPGSSTNSATAEGNTGMSKKVVLALVVVAVLVAIFLFVKMRKKS